MNDTSVTPNATTPQGTHRHRHVSSCTEHAAYVAGCQGCRDKAAAYKRRAHYRKTRYGLTGLIDARGTLRRLQALAALGHTRADIAAAGDVSFNLLNNTATRIAAAPSDKARVRATTAAAVDRAYRALHMTPGSSQATAAHAARHGWAPPMAWDDIDNDARPQGSLHVAINRRAQDDAIRAHHALGLKDREIAEAIGSTASTVRDRRHVMGLPATNLYGHPLPDQQDAA